MKIAVITEPSKESFEDLSLRQTLDLTSHFSAVLSTVINGIVDFL